MSERRTSQGGRKAPLIITMCGLLVVTVGLVLHLRTEIRRQAPPGVVSQGPDANLPSGGQERPQTPKIADRTRPRPAGLPPEDQQQESGPTPLHISEKGQEILESILKIPAANKPAPPEQIPRVTIMNSSVQNAINYLRRNKGIKINFEAVQGERKVLNAAMQNVTVEEVLQYFVENDPRYELLRSGSGWTVRPKDSPLSAIHRHFDANDTSRFQAFARVVEQMQERVGAKFHVAFGYKGTVDPPQDKVSVSLDGSAYDILDRLVRDVPGLGWEINWSRNTAWVTMAQSRKPRGSPGSKTVTISGSR